MWPLGEAVTAPDNELGQLPPPPLDHMWVGECLDLRERVHLEEVEVNSSTDEEEEEEREEVEEEDDMTGTTRLDEVGGGLEMTREARGRARRELMEEEVEASCTRGDTFDSDMLDRGVACILVLLLALVLEFALALALPNDRAALSGEGVGMLDPGDPLLRLL